jgi:hypothetical protein
MKKRLITNDYEEIIFESLKIPKTDYHNYYLNIIEEKYDYNHNIVANLTQAVSKWITWYNSKIYGKVVKAKMSDGSIQYVDENQAWGTDKNGKMIPIDLEKKSISLLLGFGIKIHVNKAFFDNLLDELSTIQEIIDFKNSVIEFENKLPESIKNKTLKIPMPVGFDFKEIKERFELIKALTDKPLDNINNEEVEKKINKFCMAMELDIPRNHFKRLTTNNSQNGKPFLTEIQLENFINKAFLGKALPKQQINRTNKEKLLVQYVFKEFYNDHNDFFNTSQVTRKFMLLLTENFIGWDLKNVMNSVSRIPKKPLQLLN